MPWFPDFTSAVELARRDTQAAGRADPVAQYFAALNEGDSHLLETVWPGEVVIYDPRQARSAATGTCGSSSAAISLSMPSGTPGPRPWPPPWSAGGPWWNWWRT